MMKKFLSLVALSATLISPALADEFGGLDYYQPNLLPIIYTQEPSTNSTHTNDNYEVRTMGAGVRYSDLSTVRLGVAMAISTLVASIGDEKAWDRAVDEFRTRAEMAYNLPSDAVERIIDKIEQYKEKEKRAEEEALAILDEEIDKLRNESEFNSGSFGGASAGGAMPPDDGDGNNRKRTEPYYKNNKEAEQAARNNGYKPTKDFKFNSKGQKVYEKGNTQITRDLDGHNGGVWKSFDKKTGQRTGTLDKNFKRIKG